MGKIIPHQYWVQSEYMIDLEYVGEEDEFNYEVEPYEISAVCLFVSYITII